MSVFKLKTKHIILGTVSSAILLFTGCSDGTARLGRLADANVKIFEISNNGKQVLKWEEITSSGNYLDEIGYFPTHDDELDQNKFYLIEISKGVDWDSDNNGVINILSVKNKGTIRAFAKGSEIKDLGDKLNVTVVSEIVYQLVKDNLNNFNSNTFQAKLNDAATKVLSYDIDGKSSKSDKSNNNYAVLVGADKSKPKYQLACCNSTPNDLDNKDILVYNPLENKNALTDQYYSKMDTYKNQIIQGKEIDLDNEKTTRTKKTVKKLPSNFKPRLISSLDIDGDARGLALSKDGTKAYILINNNGLKIIDISNQNKPTLTGSINTNGFDNDIALTNDGTKAYIADGRYGFKIINISDPKNPTFERSLNTYGYARDIKLSNDGTRAYVVNGRDGLKIIDTSNPKHPTLIGSIDTNGYALKITLSSDGTKAYIADGRKGLKIIDISNSKHPTLISSLDTNGYTFKIVLSNDGTKAYIADGEKGLKIIDISNIKNPTLIGSLDTNGWAEDIKLLKDETKAYIADGKKGLKIIDISNPNKPTLLNSLDTNGYAFKVILSNDETKAYIVDGEKGLKIIEIYYKKPIIGDAKTGLELIGKPNPIKPIF